MELVGCTLFKILFVLFLAWALAGRRLCARFGDRLAPIVALSVVVQFVIAVSFWDIRNTDIDNLQYTADLLRAGDNVYTASWPSPFFPFHPYLPLHMYLLVVADAAADLTSVPFTLFVKVPAIAAVAGTTLLVYRMAKQGAPGESAAWLAGLVAFNPVVVWAVAIHGQFDAIATFLLLAALYVQLEQASAGGKRARFVVSGLLLGLAVSLKTWPLLAVPTLVLWIRTNPGRAQFAATAAITVASVVLLYSTITWTSPDDMLRTIREYRGVPAIAGYSRILFDLPGSDAEQRSRFDFTLDHGTQIMVVGLAPIILLSLGARSAALSIATVFLGFYALASGVSAHHYVWIIPFALLGGQSGWLIAFSVMAGIFSGSEQFFWPADRPMQATVTNVLVWLLVVAWLGWNIGTILNARFGSRALAAAEASQA